MPGWAAAAALAAAGVITGGIGRQEWDVVDEWLRAPLLFLTVAVPLAVLLDRLGFFRGVARMIDESPRLPLAAWVLTAAVVAVLNLDTAVVLMTPLLVGVARHHGMDVRSLAFTPVLLASLASSTLPVSNLTTLIAAEQWHVGASDMLVHLGPPVLVAVTVGWFASRRAFGDASRTTAIVHDAPDRRAMVIGTITCGWLVVGFTVGDELGVPAWIVASIAVVGLAVVTRHVPWRAVPLDSVVLVVALGALAVSAGPHLPLDDVLTGSGALAEIRAFGVALVLAALVNNLPASLLLFAVAPPSLRWAVLLGVNMGPLLMLHGSLAGLLWRDSLHRLGIEVTAHEYRRIGWRIAVPTCVASIGVLVMVPT